MSTLRIDDLIWQIRDELMSSNTAYRVTIDLEHNLDDERMLVHGDAQLIKSAFFNILENSCKYSSDHTANVLIKSSGSSLTVVFTDRGIGISEHDLPNIFDPFYRGANAQNVKGSGIGLSIVKPILQLHGATIRVDSAIGQGTTFTVSFPAV
jgi:signal transduction histidine kinase